jgi:DNA topoisomerase-1
VQIGDTEGEEKPRYASLRTGQMMESISLEDALELFKLPKTLGQFEDKDMVVAIGKFGPYVRHDGAFYSIPKEFDPHTLEEAKAIEIIQEKRQKDIDKLIKVFDENPDARIENGRWGPYIKFGKLNIKIPKDKTPESISYAEVLVLAEAAEKEPKKGGAKRFAKKK